jgi:hypothetical protein
MRFRRRHLPLAALLAAIALSVPVSSAGAQVWPGSDPNFMPGAGVGTAGCLGSNRAGQVGGAGGAEQVVCGGITFAFVGPAIGQIASAIGPTIIGNPVVVAPITVANGSVMP